MCKWWEPSMAVVVCLCLVLLGLPMIRGERAVLENVESTVDLLGTHVESAILESAESRGGATSLGTEKVPGGHILVATIFQRGHTGPAMALTLELASRGRHVTFAVPYREGIADHYIEKEIFDHPNVTFLPLPMSEYFAGLVRNDMRIYSELTEWEFGPFLFDMLVESTLHAIDPLLNHIRNHTRLDLIISDTGFFGAILVARAFPGVPCVRLSTQMLPMTRFTSFLPSPGLDFPLRMNTWQRYVSRAIETTLKSPLTLRLGPFAKLQDMVLKSGLHPMDSLKDLDYGPVIIQSVMGLEPPHAIEPVNTYCGGIMAPQRLTDLPEDLRHWLDERETVLYVSLATTCVGTSEFWISMVQGMERLPNISILLSVRGTNKDRLPSPLPANIRQVDWVPQSTVLTHPSVKAAVNNGGANSVLEAISASLPQVAIPFHSDHFWNARSLERCGAGLRLNRNHLTSNDVERAILRVTREESFKRQAVQLRFLEDAAGGVRKAADTAELYLNLGVQGIELLRDVTTQMPWHQRTDADILALPVVLFIVLALTLGRCIGYHPHITLKEISPKKSFVKVKSS